MAESVTKTEFIDWLTPALAVALLESVFANSYVSKAVLLERLRGGMVRSMARNAAFEDGSRGELFELAATVWLNIGESDIFWTTGDLTHVYYERITRDRKTVRFFDLRFEPQTVRDIVSNAPKKSPVEPAKVNPVSGAEPSKPVLVQPTQPAQAITGAPRKAWWDDLWVEICMRIYRGTLIPTKQKDIENAMMDWAEKNGDQTVGVQTVRPAARKLWNVWKDEKDEK